jgi:hypothetical protein
LKHLQVGGVRPGTVSHRRICAIDSPVSPEKPVHRYAPATIPESWQILIPFSLASGVAPLFLACSILAEPSATPNPICMQPRGAK